MREKGLDVFFEEVDLIKWENWSEDFLIKNLFGGILVLELDDGMYIVELMVICCYFEGLYFEFNLFGEILKESVFIEMWICCLEFYFML